MDNIKVDKIFAEALVGRCVDSVGLTGGETFACSFDSGASLSIMTLSKICADGAELQSTQPGFRAALRQLLGQVVESFENADEYFLIRFGNGSQLQFSNRIGDFEPPEAAVFGYKDAGIVWSGPDSGLE